MQGFGAKVDARLKELEAKFATLHDRLDALLEEICTTDEGVALLSKRLAELEAKRVPGRPPKAQNGE